jgi:hypothetical protein
MDVTSQVDSIVENLVRGIETRLEARLEQTVTAFLQSKLDAVDVDKKLNWLASVKVDNLIGALSIDQTTVQQRIDQVTDTVVNGIEAECRKTSLERIRHRINSELDINKLVKEVLSSELQSRINEINFPAGSISGSAINVASLKLTGDNVQGGLIKNFGSSGIQDLSTNVQLTLLDQAVVIENNVVTLGLEVKGTTVLEGDLVIHGNVPPQSQFYTSLISNAVEGVKNSMNQEFFGDYASVIFERIKEEGLDLNRITLNGTEVITGNKLNYGITDTNITRVGMVKDLQTQGETYLSEVLYVGKDRVGVNTLEPAFSLSVWDQEVELGMGKRSRDVGWIGTSRRQDLVLSANNQDNIVLKQDGSVAVLKIQVNKIHITSSTGTPSGNEPRGTVAFNENPAPGQPIGWVSLGNGSWSRFGTVG